MPKKQKQKRSLDFCVTDFIYEPASLIMAGFFYTLTSVITTSHIIMYRRKILRLYQN